MKKAPLYAAAPIEGADGEWAVYFLQSSQEDGVTYQLMGQGEGDFPEHAVEDFLHEWVEVLERDLQALYRGELPVVDLSKQAVD